MSALSEHTLSYLKEHNVAQLMEYIMQNLIMDRPAKPSQYIRELLERPIMPIIIISGPPGSGKGTQCRAIVEHFGVVHLSSGELLRQEVRAGTQLGKIAETCMKNGELVPEKLIISIIRRRIQEDDVKECGLLLDGFPRSLEQAVALEEAGLLPHMFLKLEVDDDVVLERIEHRRTDPATGAVYHLLYNPPPEDDVVLCERLIQREDDQTETVKRRLQFYHNTIDNLKRHYGTLMETIDGSQCIEEVTKATIAAVEKRLLR